MDDRRAKYMVIWLIALSAHCSAVTAVVIKAVCIISNDSNFRNDVSLLQYSVNYVHTRTDLFPLIRFQMDYQYTDGDDQGSAVNALVRSYYPMQDKVLIFGATYSSQSEWVAAVARYYRLPQIGYANTSPALSNTVDYPYFIRMYGNNALNVNPALEILRTHNWLNVGLLTSDYGVVFPVSQEIESKIGAYKIKLLAKEVYKSDATDSLSAMLSKNVRIFLSVRSVIAENPMNSLPCTIYNLGAYGEKYLWIHIGMPRDLMSFVNDSCTPDQMARAMEGSLEMDTEIATYNGIGINNMTSAEMYQDFLSVYPSLVNKTAMSGLTGLDIRMDSVVTAAFAASKSVDEMRAANISENDTMVMREKLFQNIIKTDFMGHTGRVNFAINGDRMANVLIYQLRSMKREYVGTYNVWRNSINWTKPLWFQGAYPPKDVPRLVLQKQIVSRVLIIIMITLAVIGIFFTGSTMLVNFLYRHLRFIKMSSPNINYIIGCGCILCFGSCIVMSVNSHWLTTTSLCWVEQVCLALGYASAYGGMLAKTWRVHRIFTNKRLRSMAIKDRHLAGVVAVLLAADTVFFVIWGLLDPPVVRILNLPDQEDVDNGIITRPQIHLCRSDNWFTWLGVLFGMKGILLVIGIFLAWETRNVYIEGLNDSKKIGICVYNTMVMGLIGVTLSFVLPESEHSLRYVLISACILIGCTTTIVLIFGHKVYQLIKVGPNKVDDLEIEQPQGSSSTASQHKASR